MASEAKYNLEQLVQVNIDTVSLKGILEHLLARDRETAEQISKINAKLEGSQKESNM
jgi:hypothetical protein